MVAGVVAPYKFSTSYAPVRLSQGYHKVVIRVVTLLQPYYQIVKSLVFPCGLAYFFT